MAWFNNMDYCALVVSNSYRYVVVQVHKAREGVLAMVKSDLLFEMLGIVLTALVFVIAILYEPAALVILIVAGIVIPLVETGFWLHAGEKKWNALK